MRRQARVGQRFELDGRHACGHVAEVQLVGVGLRDVAARKDGVVRLHGEQREIRLRRRGAQRDPLHGAGALTREPLGKFFVERGFRRRCGVGRRRDRLRRGIFSGLRRGGCGWIGCFRRDGIFRRIFPRHSLRTFRRAFARRFCGRFFTGFHRGLRRPLCRQLGEELLHLDGVLFALLLCVGGRDVHVGLVGVVHERHDLEILAMRERVELMRVALRAAEREAEPRRAGCGDAIGHRVKTELVRIDAALLVQHRVTVKARRDFLIERRAGQHVSRDLLDGELIERLVRIERVDDPVAIRPDAARAILFVAIRVGVARQVEPLAGPALAIAGRSEQLVGERFHCGVRIADRGLDEVVLLLRRRRDAREIEVKSAAQRGGVRLRRGREAGAF